MKNSEAINLGIFHNLTGRVNLGFSGESLAWSLNLKSSDIQTIPALTWLGDLAGSTGRAYQIGNAKTGYELEMPPEDFESDMLGTILTKNNVITPTGTNLAQELSNALASDSPYVVKMYPNFADTVNIKYDPLTGKLDASTAQSFLISNTEMVADLGSGFYAKQTGDPTVISSNNQNLMRSYAEDQIKSFLEQLEQGLQVEVGK